MLSFERVQERGLNFYAVADLLNVFYGRDGFQQRPGEVGLLLRDKLDIVLVGVKLALQHVVQEAEDLIKVHFQHDGLVVLENGHQHLEDSLPFLLQDDVPDVKYHFRVAFRGVVAGEEGQEPRGGKVPRLHLQLFHVLSQVRQLDLEQAVQLVEEYLDLVQVLRHDVFEHEIHDKREKLERLRVILENDVEEPHQEVHALAVIDLGVVYCIELQQLVELALVHQALRVPREGPHDVHLNQLCNVLEFLVSDENRLILHFLLDLRFQLADIHDAHRDLHDIEPDLSPYVDEVLLIDKLVVERRRMLVQKLLDNKPFEVVVPLLRHQQHAQVVRGLIEILDGPRHNENGNGGQLLDLLLQNDLLVLVFHGLHVKRLQKLPVFLDFNQADQVIHAQALPNS